MERITHTMRKPTEDERRIWPTADHIIEPGPRSCMPPPRYDWLSGARRPMSLPEPCDERWTCEGMAIGR